MSGYINNRWSHKPTQVVESYPKPDNQIRGLGDVVHQVARLTGIERAVKAVEKVTKRPCGCAKRREKLNRAFPMTPRGQSDGT